MPLDGIIGSGIGAALSAEAASRSRKWARKNYRHRFQWSMQDMREAGLNPILAAGGGLGGSGGMGNVPPAQVPDIGRNVNTAKQVGNQRRLWNAQIDATTATAAKTRQETLNLARQQPFNELMKLLQDYLAKPGSDAARGAIGTAKEAMSKPGSYRNLGQTMLDATEQALQRAIDLYNENQPRKNETWQQRQRRLRKNR